LNTNLYKNGYFLTNNKQFHISEQLFPGFFENGDVYVHFPFAGDLNQITNITESHSIFFAYTYNGRYEGAQFIGYKIFGSSVRLKFRTSSTEQAYRSAILRYEGTITIS